MRACRMAPPPPPAPLLQQPPRAHRAPTQPPSRLAHRARRHLGPGCHLCGVAVSSACAAAQHGRCQEAAPLRVSLHAQLRARAESCAKAARCVHAGRSYDLLTPVPRHHCGIPGAAPNAGALCGCGTACDGAAASTGAPCSDSQQAGDASPRKLSAHSHMGEHEQHHTDCL